jgi:beta-phosphoglucomutase-like phosphatase (HAD superfamily)
MTIPARNGPIRGILYDMDGTLVESKEIWYKLLAAFSLAHNYGELTHERWEPTYGQSMKANRDIFFPNNSVEDVNRFCNDNFKKFIDILHILPGALDTLTATCQFLERNSPLAIESHSCYANYHNSPRIDPRFLICTNCPSPITRTMIDPVKDMSDFFASLSIANDQHTVPHLSRTVCASEIISISIINHPKFNQTSSLSPDQISSLKLADFDLPPYNLSKDEFSLLLREGQISYTLKPKPSTDLISYACFLIDIPADQCLFVGDSKFDMDAGEAAGCITIGIGQKSFNSHIGLKNIGELGQLLSSGEFD